MTSVRGQSDMDEEVRYAVANTLRHLRNGDAESAAVYAHSVHGDWITQFGSSEADIMIVAVQTAIEGTEFAGYELPVVRGLTGDIGRKPSGSVEGGSFPGRAMLRQQIRDIETAIHSHPPKTVGVYETATGTRVERELSGAAST